MNQPNKLNSAIISMLFDEYCEIKQFLNIEDKMEFGRYYQSISDNEIPDITNDTIKKFLSFFKRGIDPKNEIFEFINNLTTEIDFFFHSSKYFRNESDYSANEIQPQDFSP